MFFPLYSNHYYTFAATGLKIKSKDFCTREAATKYMYKVCKKYGLRIENVWDDNHFKTYLCNNGIRFYIQRV